VENLRQTLKAGWDPIRLAKRGIPAG
jgi:hypothetical protein